MSKEGHIEGLACPVVQDWGHPGYMLHHLGNPAATYRGGYPLSLGHDMHTYSSLPEVHFYLSCSALDPCQGKLMGKAVGVTSLAPHAIPMLSSVQLTSQHLLRHRPCGSMSVLQTCVRYTGWLSIGGYWRRRRCSPEACLMAHRMVEFPAAIVGHTYTVST